MNSAVLLSIIILQTTSTTVAEFTVIKLDFVILLLPLEFFTVRVTVYFPSLLYVCTGFLAVEDVPSPKFQFCEVGVPVLLSIKTTFNGA